MKEIKDYCYDVPLIDSLQVLLNCNDVREQVNIIIMTCDITYMYNSRYFLHINLEMTNWVIIVMATNIEDILCLVKMKHLCK